MEDIFKSFIHWYNEYKQTDNFSPTLSVSEFGKDPNTNKSVFNPARVETLYRPTVRNIDYYCAEACDTVYTRDNSKRKQFIGPNFTLQNAVSTERTAVYVSNSLIPTAIIAIRGTASSLLDIATDALVLFGKEYISRRNELQSGYIKEVIQTLKNKFPLTNDNIYICGHSLGGILALYATYFIPRVNGVGFNIGSSPAQIAELTRPKNPLGIKGEKKVFSNPRFTNYTVQGDLISASSIFLIPNTIVLKPKPVAASALEAHKMSFLLKSIQPQFPFQTNLRTNRRKGEAFINGVKLESALTNSLGARVNTSPTFRLPPVQ